MQVGHQGVQQMPMPANSSPRLGPEARLHPARAHAANSDQMGAYLGGTIPSNAAQTALRRCFRCGVRHHQALVGHNPIRHFHLATCIGQVTACR